MICLGNRIWYLQTVDWGFFYPLLMRPWLSIQKYRHLRRRKTGELCVFIKHATYVNICVFDMLKLRWRGGWQLVLIKCIVQAHSHTFGQNQTLHTLIMQVPSKVAKRTLHPSSTNGQYKLQLASIQTNESMVAWPGPCPIDAPSGCSIGQFSTSNLIMQEIITISNSWPAFGNSSQLPPYNHILNECVARPLERHSLHST